MTALANFFLRQAGVEGYYCPCCKTVGLDPSDMDLAREWEHSGAMHARYGAVCCKGCTDDHVATVEGDCLPQDRAFYSRELWQWFSTDDGRQEAETAYAFDAWEWQSDCAMMEGWR